jgi:hypothetical protein
MPDDREQTCRDGRIPDERWARIRPTAARVAPNAACSPTAAACLAGSSWTECIA